MYVEMGEFIVGAYLKYVEECDLVNYRVRPAGGGLKGLDELDVLGLKFSTSEIFLCEVKTQITGGLSGKGAIEFVADVKKKLEKQKDYAQNNFTVFQNRIYMFWSPVIPVGKATEALSEIKGMDIIINSEYKKRVDTIKEKARDYAGPTDNDFFRALQILEHLRE